MTGGRMPGHPGCPPAMSQRKLRKRNKTVFKVLPKSATKTISKRTQAKSPDCGQCAVAAARWPKASEQRQELIENLTKTCVVSEPPPRVSEGGSSFLTNQKICKQSHTWHPEGMRPKANTGRSITKGRWRGSPGPAEPVARARRPAQ